MFVLLLGQPLCVKYTAAVLLNQNTSKLGQMLKHIIGNIQAFCILYIPWNLKHFDFDQKLPGNLAVDISTVARQCSTVTYMGTSPLIYL